MIIKFLECHKNSIFQEVKTKKKKMLMSKRTNVKLRKTYNKILYLYEAFNETFVFLGMMGPKKDCLVHVNKYGKELFCYNFELPMDTLGMINEYEAIVLETRANVITIFNLKSYEIKRIPHYFINQESDQCYLFTFPDTKYMTVVQYGRYNDNRLKITYYNYPRKNPTISEKTKLLIHHHKELLQKDYESKDDEWTFQYQIVQANNHSMVIWYKARHDETFQFKFFRQDRNYWPLHRYDKDNSNGWEYRCIKIDHKLGDLYNFNRLNLCVNEVMQIQKDKLLIYCLSNRDKPQTSKEQLKNTYILDLLTQNIVESPHDLGHLQEYQIDRKFFGNIHMIRTFQFVHGQCLPSPVYYFSNDTFEEIYQQMWVCKYRTKYSFPGYDSFVMLQNEYENANVKQFTCFYKKIVELREIILFFMLQINEDFDQDLLHDVISLTC